MADRIITVTNPSVVTNDTLSGYNNYSDIDGQLGAMMTPTEATNGHTVTLSDGATHQVTSKPVGTTNGEFSASISNAVEVVTIPSIILYQTDFPGTSNADWTITNPNTSNVVLSIDNAYKAVFSGTIGGSSRDDYMWYNKTPFTSPTVVFSFELDNSLSGLTNNFLYGITTDATFQVWEDDLRFTRGTTGGQVRAQVRKDAAPVGTGNTIDHTFTTDDVRNLKVSYDGVNAIFSYWSINTTEWVVWRTEPVAYTGSWTPYFSDLSSEVLAETRLVNKVFITSEDFTTQYPE